MHISEHGALGGADPQLAPYANLRLSIDRSDSCVPSNA
jgi:hypothetical protein